MAAIDGRVLCKVEGDINKQMLHIFYLSIPVQQHNYEAFNTLFTTPKNWGAYYM